MLAVVRGCGCGSGYVIWMGAVLEGYGWLRRYCTPDGAEGWRQQRLLEIWWRQSMSTCGITRRKADHLFTSEAPGRSALYAKGQSCCWCPASPGYRCSCVCFFCAANTRLVGGPDELSGRVEVRHNSVWGTVCDDGWDDTDAFVVCQSLGYSGGTAREGGTFGEGSGDIWLSNVNCSGTERDVTECPHGGWGGHNCLHKEDAGVVCSPAGACAVPRPSFVGPLLPGGLYVSVAWGCGVMTRF